MNRVVCYLTNVALDREKGTGALCLRPVLWVLSLAYGSVVMFVRWLYEAGIFKVFQAPVPVISVGNLTAGGTGKTPFVAMLCKVLMEEGYNPMVLTRGFMGGQGGASDEAEMLKELVGPRVFTGADRVRSFQSSFKAGGYDCVILDDGFQQWRFKRDLDIILVDSREPLGNGFLIPRGILRESPGMLRRAGVLVLTRVDRVSTEELDLLKARLKRIASDAVLFQGVHRVCAVRDVFGEGTIEQHRITGPAAAFCAIGDPDSFKRTLKGAGIDLKVFIPFEDHYRYITRDVKKIVGECREKKLGNVFITHKDYVKLKDFRDLFNGIRLIVIDVEFELTYGKTELVSIIRRLRRS